MINESFDNIPQELRELKQWVNVWKNSKIPMQSNIRKSASSVNAASWSTYQDAVDSVEVGNYDNIGFVFNNNGIVGIDIDTGFENGKPTDLLKDIVLKCKSYTEISRSGRGIHILLKGSLPFKGKNNGNGLEIYQASRYFIVTGDVFLYYDMIDNQEAIDYILQTYFGDQLKESSSDKHNDTVYKPVYKVIKGKLTTEYPAIPSGMRNISLASLAGQLHSAGADKKSIYRQLVKVNQIACTPPLSDREIQTIVESITKYRRTNG